MGIRFYDTNLSYHFSLRMGTRGVAIDWWYDIAMRHRWWMPLQIRFHRQLTRVERERELCLRGICPLCGCEDCMADGRGMLWCPNCDI